MPLIFGACNSHGPLFPLAAPPLTRPWHAQVGLGCGLESLLLLQRFRRRNPVRAIFGATRLVPLLPCTFRRLDGAVPQAAS